MKPNLNLRPPDRIDPPYTSRQEQKIGHMLEQYDFLAFYKQPTIIYSQEKNEIWHPTFTLPQYGGLIIDYIVEAEEKKIQNSINHKTNIYRYNQIPATVLGPKYLDKPNWEQDLYNKIQEEFQQDLSLSGSIVHKDMPNTNTDNHKCYLVVVIPSK